MIILNIHLARSIWLFPINDLNPEGKSLYPVIPLLVDLYKFKDYPKEETIPDYTKGIKFMDGQFKNEAGHVTGINFEVYSDGVVAETRSSTKDSEAFLIEVSRRLSSDFGLPPYEKFAGRRNYISQIYFTTEKSLETINPKLKEILQYLTDTFSESFRVGALAFWPDQKLTRKPPPFLFERVIDVPFSEKRYFSSCGLQTDEHMALIEKIEDILSIS